MPPKAANPIPLPDGRAVVTHLKRRGDVYRVQYRDPITNKYRETSTHRRTEHEAWAEAGRIVLAAYTASGLKPTARTVTWEQALAELEKHGGKRTVKLRKTTLKMYRQAVANLQKTVTTKGPGDITPDVARRFATLYASTPYTRSPKDGAKKYTRNARTVDNAIHFASCLFSALADMNLAGPNPFKDCPRPVVDTARPNVPAEADFANLFAYVDSLGWELMAVLAGVKAVAGCRTQDLCQVRASQFDPKARTLTITADQNKTHKTRTVHLPPALSARLAAIAPTTPTAYLWGRYTDDTRERDARASGEFTPARLGYAVRRMFAGYSRKFPDRPITPHDLRARAITQAVRVCEGSVDAGAELIGVTPATARKHYIDPDKAFGTEAARKRLAEMLMPK